jgi:zinc/manganese transport system substrate-binding protein
MPELIILLIMILIIGGESRFCHLTGLRLLAGVVAVAVVLSACVVPEESSDGPLVVTTTNLLGDIAANVVGDEGTVVPLMPIGVDPHDYRPSSQDVAIIANADLVIANGLGLEPGLEDVLEAAQGDGVQVLEVAPLLDSLPFHDGSGLDPHFWLDPRRVVLAADLIARRLDGLDLPGEWMFRARDYQDQLEKTERTMSAELDRIDPAKRKLVTNHEVLGYFASRYGFRVVGVVIPGGSTLAEPSSSALADLIAVIEAEQVPAIFADTTDSVALAETVAAESGREISVVELYTESLGPPGSGADTVIDMLLTNARRIAGALG